MNNQVFSKAMREQAAELIRGKILSGEYAPGQELRQEKLAQDFGVSRTPIREALQLLASEGLITLPPHRGAVVNDLDPEHIREYYELLALLEGEAFFRACQNTVTEADKRIIADIARNYADEGNRGDFAALLAIAIQLNEYVYSHCGNRRLAALIQQYIAYDTDRPAEQDAFSTNFRKHFIAMLSAWQTNNADTVRREIIQLNAILSEHYLQLRAQLFTADSTPSQP